MVHINNIKISAIVPTYNSEKYLYETLLSLTNQTNALTEIIVVDDGSVDQTRQIVDQFKSQSNISIKALFLNENQGVAHARNKGINEASGDWILLMDSDDTIKPNLLEDYKSYLSLMEKESKDYWVLIHSASEQMDASGNPIEGIQGFKQVLPKEILGYEFVRNHVFVSGTMINKNAVERVGGFDRNLKYSEDWDLWLKLAAIGGFVYVDKSLVKVRRHGSNASANVQLMLNGERNVLAKYNIDTIRNAIHKRNLVFEKNETDFISILFRLEKWDMGLSLLEKLINENNKYPPFYFLRGLFYLQNRELYKVIADFKAAIQLNPNDCASLNNLGAALSLTGKKDAGLKILKSAILLQPNYNDAKKNIDYIEKEPILEFEKMCFTWRELRDQLTKYDK